MRAGGATSLAKSGVPPNIIQAIGQWCGSAEWSTNATFLFLLFLVHPFFFIIISFHFILG